jgi:parvulin-like peptidyl-prolyl isomerase
MPRKTVRKSTKELSKVHEMIDTKMEDLMPLESVKPVRRLPWVRVVVVVVVLSLVAFFVANKGLVVAAVVDGRPIFRWQLNSVMSARYGAQTLDSMISQALIDEQAQKAGVKVSQTDITTREADLVKSLGTNVSLDDVLKYQGMTKADFEDQLRLQITVEKLLGKDITISDADITNYIATNASTLTATDEAGQRSEAKQAIFSQEINDQLQTWFAGIKAKASILNFL